MKRIAVLALALVVPLVGCDKKKDNGGLPPASKWGNSGEGGGATSGSSGGGIATDTDPHAGMDMSGSDPHAGLDMSGAGGVDPHAGLDMSGAGGGNPHGGGGDGTGVPGARAPDPTHAVKGTITLDPKVASQVKPGMVLFLFAKRDDGTGKPAGMPLVAQINEKPDFAAPIAYDLNETNSMLPGVPDLTGEVWVGARLDQDSNATSKSAGDIVGWTKVTVPAKDIKISLSEVLAQDQ